MAKKATQPRSSRTSAADPSRLADLVADPANRRVHNERNLTMIATAGQVITRWTFSDEERRRILEGEDLYVTILSHGAINPLFCSVGPVNWTTRAETP